MDTRRDRAGHLGTSSAAPTGRRRAAALALGRPLVLALVILCATSAVFVEAFHAPSPHAVDVGVVGRPAAAALVRHELALGAPGGFRVHGYATEPQARRALLDTDVRGVLIPSARGDRAIVAQAYGVPETKVVTDAFSAVAARSGTTLRVTDAAPLPAHDRLGLSSLFVVVGMLLPSLAFGALLAFLAAGQPWWRRWGVIVGYGVLAALVVSVNVDLLIGALTGTFVGLAVVAGLLAAAVATGTHGLARLLGPVGLAVAVGLFLIVGLPSSGGAVTHELQPGFYGAVSQWLPPGAALVALRDVVYFDWSGAAQPLLALGAWIVAGFSLAAVAERRGRRGSGDDAETSVAISEDMRDIVDRTMLGFVATVCEDGSPNVSPKGSIRVYDDHHLVFVDTASPGTVGNLRRDPRVEVSCVDFLRRRGYRFKGRGEVLDPGDPVHIWVHRWLLETHGPAIPAHHAVKISVEQVRPTHMRAAYIERFGSPDVIRVGELSEPTPGPRQVLVRVAAVAVNHVDALIREGTWRTPLSFPFVIGRDLVGSVVEVGSLVDEFAPGQRVWADSLGYGGRQGALAEYAVVDAERLYQLPEGLDPVGSVACFHPALTAHLGLMRELGGVGPGDTVFVNGGSGAVGNAVIQLAVAAGARVFATASTSDGEERCRAAGATVLPGDEPGLGVDVCWDAHGSNDLAHATETLAPGGAPTSFPLRAEAERLNGG